METSKCEKQGSVTRSSPFTAQL